MGFRTWLAMNVSPIFLRVALAVSFLWAGYSKLAYNDPVSGEDAAILANLGVIDTTPPRLTPAPAEAPSEPPTEADPTQPQPSPDVLDGPASPPSAPETAPTSKPDTKPESISDNDDANKRFGAMRVIQASAPGTSRSVEAVPTGEAGTLDPAPPAYTAEDFSDPVKVARLYKITLLLHKASHPSDPAQQLWPTPLSTPRAIVMLAWAAALTEAVCGAFVLFGFLTRLSALGLASTMAVAMLLTTVGPAAVTGDGFLGLLPSPRLHEPDGWVAAWSTMLFQFTLLMGSLSLAALGPGALAIDGLFAGGSPAKVKSPAPGGA